MDVDELYSAEDFEGSVEDLIDCDEEFSPQEGADALRSVLELVAAQLKQR